MCVQCRRPRFDPWVGKIPWRREWQPTPVFLSGASCGQRSLTGYSPWGCTELDTTERLSLTHSLKEPSVLCLDENTGLSLETRPTVTVHPHKQLFSLQTVLDLQWFNLWLLFLPLWCKSDRHSVETHFESWVWVLAGARQYRTLLWWWGAAAAALSHHAIAGMNSLTAILYSDSRSVSRFQ